MKNKIQQKCKHLNGVLIEVMWAHHEREIEDGEMDEIGTNEILEIDHYEYRCHDCGKKYKFSGLEKAPLKFLREKEL